MVEGGDSLLNWLLGQLRRGLDEEIVAAKLAAGPEELEAALIPLITAAVGAASAEAVGRLSAISSPAGAPVDAKDAAEVWQYAMQILALESGERLENGESLLRALDLPVLQFELVLVSPDAFLTRLEQVEPEAILPLVIATNDRPDPSCPHCRRPLSVTGPGRCESCGNPVSVVRMLPFVPAATVQVSYRSLREIIRWPEVASFSPAMAIELERSG